MAVIKYLLVVMTGLTCLECKQLKATTTPQTIESYGYSMGIPYLSNMFQTWIIETKDSLNVVEVEINMDTEPCCDRLELYDGSSSGHSLGVFRGTYTGEKVKSSGRNMYVVFRSDSSVEMRGFQIVYKQVKEKDTFWMVVGIVLAGLITILCVALILFLCGVCESKNQVFSIRLNYCQHQEQIWMTSSPQNHFQVVPAQFVHVPPQTYQAVTYQNPQAMEMQDMNQRILPGAVGNAMSSATHNNILVNSLPPTQHYEKT